MSCNKPMNYAENLVAEIYPQLANDLPRTRPEDVYINRVGRVSEEVIDSIASYAFPVGDDARVAWYDYEEQCKMLRDCHSVDEVEKHGSDCIIILAD
jgi:hypothetical protein